MKYNKKQQLWKTTFILVLNPSQLWLLKCCRTDDSCPTFFCNSSSFWVFRIMSTCLFRKNSKSEFRPPERPQKCSEVISQAGQNLSIQIFFSIQLCFFSSSSYISDNILVQKQINKNLVDKKVLVLNSCSSSFSLPSQLIEKLFRFQNVSKKCIKTV